MYVHVSCGLATRDKRRERKGERMNVWLSFIFFLLSLHISTGHGWDGSVDGLSVTMSGDTFFSVFFFPFHGKIGFAFETNLRHQIKPRTKKNTGEKSGV